MWFPWRSFHRQVRDLPLHHQVLFWLTCGVLLWQSVYLTQFTFVFLYGSFSVPVHPPNLCEINPTSYEIPSKMKAGQVLFRVDMRCVKADFKSVFVTSPVCGDCGPEKWNTLTDVDDDGVYEGVVTFRGPGGQALVGTGIQYRYGIETQDHYYPENLLHEVHAERAYCAPVSDFVTYANRVVETDTDGTEVREIFGTCHAVVMSEDEWGHQKEMAFAEANPWLVKHVDPIKEVLDPVFAVVLIFDPILFLTLCSVLYVGSIAIIGRGYVSRKENALMSALNEAQHKNTYLEHAAKILRHDMHSGINTYIPRGIRSLERRLEKCPDVVKEMRLEAPLRLLKEGLAHTQKVYAGVTEFTNLVKAGAEIERKSHDLREILVSYLDTTSYKDQVVIDRMPTVSVNAPLFCTALDNLIRNGLKYNDSPSKMVIVTMVDDLHLGILDNGRGMTQGDFLEYSKPYVRKADQKELGSGLGLNICIAILHEHGFPVTCSERDEGGTLIKVKIQ